MNESRLTLGATLDNLAQLSPWIGQLAAAHGIPENVQFAIHVCLEEVLSNIIRHGYQFEAGRRVTVSFSKLDTESITFSIDDEAPHFNPLAQTELPALDSDDNLRIGGQGLRLLRRFADTLEYDQLPKGNRLRIGFSTPGA